MEYPNNDLNNNFNNMNNNVPNGAAPKKSGKAGLIVLIIFLLLVIVALVVLFVFKEKIFPAAQNTPAANQNAIISNSIENTTNPSNIINPTAQNQLINSVKGYWIATTGDLFLAITDTTDSSGQVTTNFSLTGSTGITSTTCTIDSTKITCSDKVYEYKVQGNYLILSYDNVTRNFAPSNYYQLSKQSKNYYATMMGYTITHANLPSDCQITGEYTNNALVGTWTYEPGHTKLVFSIVDGNLTVSKINTATNETILNIPVGMDKKYIEFVDNSSLGEEIYSYTLIDNNTLELSGITDKGVYEYRKEQ